jgi:hypothetical protein
LDPFERCEYRPSFASAYRWDAAEKIIDWSKTKNLQPHAAPVPPLRAELIESIKPNEFGWFVPSAKDPSKPVIHRRLDAANMPARV